MEVYKTMNTKTLYFGNLPWAMTDEDLKALAAPYGNVISAKVQLDSKTGRSRGFGFVEVPDDGTAEKIIKAWNGQMYGERALTVNESVPRQGRPTDGRRP